MTAATLRAAALEAERAGKADDAAALLSRAAALAPSDDALLNSVGSFHARHGAHAEALRWFDRALAIAPNQPDATLNRLIALGALGHHPAAWDAALAIEAQFEREPRYWSIRGNLARGAGRAAEAALAYDRCLALTPAHARALHGRARVALERGEPDASARFDQALATTPDDAQLWLGQAQALDMAGQSERADAILAALIAQAPHWPDPYEALAQHRFARGDPDFCGHYRASAAPYDSSVALSWARMLAGGQRPGEAAAVLHDAAARATDARPLRFAEAVYAGEAREDARAAALFAGLTPRNPDEQAQVARHLLRCGEITAAERMLAAATATAPDHVAAWALRDLAWRLLGDARHEWLHGQPGLVAVIPLSLPAAPLAAAVDALRGIHEAASRPVGQSVRGGTQTRGGLFDRVEPALVPLRVALDAAVAHYREALPPADRDHPLLRRRDANWIITRSWSVRLQAAGRHAAHIHPEGIVSSAAHLVAPPVSADDPTAGALELGRPPADLGLTVPSVAVIAPRPGWIALFPSTLYHGTRPFARSERLTVAFDVATR